MFVIRCLINPPFLPDEWYVLAQSPPIVFLSPENSTVFITIRDTDINNEPFRLQYLVEGCPLSRFGSRLCLKMQDCSLQVFRKRLLFRFIFGKESF